MTLRPKNISPLLALLASASVYAPIAHGADAAPAAAAGTAAASAQPLAGAQADDVAAVVNDRVITFADWSKHCAPLQPTFDAINNQVIDQYPNDMQKARDEFNKQVHALSMDVLKSMVDRLLIIHEFENPADASEKRSVPDAYLERQFEDQMTTT
ncbi:MAG TPA: hypothetical protein VK737_12955, partial [Opitutales bacterium]|nr:hypothetical protein [Opitutales bacterium]